MLSGMWETGVEGVLAYRGGVERGEEAGGGITVLLMGGRRGGEEEKGRGERKNATPQARAVDSRHALLTNSFCCELCSLWYVLWSVIV